MATYSLRAHKGATHSTSVKASTPSGQWGGFMCRKRSAYSLRVHKGGIQSTSVKASTPSGRWRKCQGKYRRRARTEYGFCEHTREPCTRMSAKASTPTGRWGGFMKASTHVSDVGVDIAAVECDCTAVDVGATSRLPNKESTSVKASTPSGRWGRFMV